MSEAVIVAIITGAITLIGNYFQNSKTLAVIETKINYLTEEVKKHNNLFSKVPVIEEQIKVANNRIKDLEGIHASK